MGPYYDTAITHHWPELQRALEPEMMRPSQRPVARQPWAALALVVAVLAIGVV